MCLGPKGAPRAAHQGSDSCCPQTPNAHLSSADGGIWWPCSPAGTRPRDGMNYFSKHVSNMLQVLLHLYLCVFFPQLIISCGMVVLKRFVYKK